MPVAERQQEPGTMTGHYQVTPIGVEGATLVNHVEGPIEGTASY